MGTVYLPSLLQEMGYRTGALVSMSSIGPDCPLNRGFDTYRLMPRHNDMRAMLAELEFPSERPSFWLLNVGETHYPYALPDDDCSKWPRLSGAGGILRGMMAGQKFSTPAFFDDEQLAALRARQVRAVEYLDGVFKELFDLLPKNTWVCIMADHGELFGEAGYFGHGPINHPTVFEVPFIEGLLG
jgi:arylsulfatase A-like enzyme